MAGGRSIRNGVAAVAVVASILVHVGFLIAVLSRQDTASFSETSRVDLDIVAPFPFVDARSFRRPPAAPGKKTLGDRAPPPEVRPMSPRATADAMEAVPPPADTARSVQGARDAAVRAALRGRPGCERATVPGLSNDERRRCEDRWAARMAQVEGPTSPKFDLSKGGAFKARDEVPYLARKPKNGCKVMAGGQTSAMGQEAAVAGVGCAIVF